MLHQVKIENYRGFRSYEMKGLSRVNLLVGKNNSGKTALLEGIQFLTSHGDPGVLAEVAQRRGELIMSRPEESHQQVDIAHFFHGHTLTTESAFQLSGDNGYPPINVRAFLHKNGKNQPDSRRAEEPPSFMLAIHRKPDEPFLLRITRDGGVDIERGFRRMGIRRASGSHVRFVGSDSLNTIELAAMWNEVQLSGKEGDIAEALQVLEPSIASVHILTAIFASGFYPARGGVIAGFKGQDGRLPLGSMGDGMRRMMVLAVALAFTKEGCLFIDEIDTGLHYSVMSDMWKMVISKAKAANTQVFATTHSWDCIEGLSLLCEREPALVQEVAVHKIDRDIPRSIVFSGESVVRMGKADLDPR